MFVIGQGQVRALQLPQGWQERVVPQDSLAVKMVRLFHPAGNQHAQMRFVYRGGRVASRPADNFKRCLSMAPHVLDRQEVDALAVVLGEYCNATEFQLSIAQTIDLKNRQVLWVEGNWRRQPYWEGAVFVDADGTGSLIQEISCLALIDERDDYLLIFKSCLESVQWV